MLNTFELFGKLSSRYNLVLSIAGLNGLFLSVCFNDVLVRETPGPGATKQQGSCVCVCVWGGGGIFSLSFLFFHSLWVVHISCCCLKRKL